MLPSKQKTTPSRPIDVSHSTTGKQFAKGLSVGDVEGLPDVGADDGQAEGTNVTGSAKLGASDGIDDGLSVPTLDGAAEGSADGNKVGITVGGRLGGAMHGPQYPSPF